MSFNNSELERQLHNREEQLLDTIIDISQNNMNAVNRERQEMEGFKAPKKYEKYLKIVIVILALLSPLFIYLWLAL